MSETLTENGLVDTIEDFLREIGLNVWDDEIHDQTFLPGILIDHGTLRVDRTELQYPGDLLHEAGHLAVMTPERRRCAHVNVGKDGGEEMAAIAWSYAAALHLQLDPAIVFHSGGYRGGSRALIENFARGQYIGVPLLQWMGLTTEPRPAKARGVEPYPKMEKWLRDE